jgi:hypothetical protein
MGVWTVGTKEHAEMLMSRAREPSAVITDIIRVRKKFLGEYGILKCKDIANPRRWSLVVKNW